MVLTELGIGDGESSLLRGIPIPEKDYLPRARDFLNNGRNPMSGIGQTLSTHSYFTLLNGSDLGLFNRLWADSNRSPIVFQGLEPFRILRLTKEAV